MIAEEKPLIARTRPARASGSSSAGAARARAPGTFYTRPAAGRADGPPHAAAARLRPAEREPTEPDEDAPAAEWTPKKPEDILALKVCDPAWVRASFLVAALRFLTEALCAEPPSPRAVSPTQARGQLVTLAERPKPLERSASCAGDAALPARRPEDFEPRLEAILRRYVVERCLYGVDLDPLAVELAAWRCGSRPWTATCRSGSSITSSSAATRWSAAWFDRFRDYPVLAWEREGGDKNAHQRRPLREGAARTRAIKDVRKEPVKPRSADADRAGRRPFRRPASTVDAASRARRGLRKPWTRCTRCRSTTPDERARLYREICGVASASGARRRHSTPGARCGSGRRPARTTRRCRQRFGRAPRRARGRVREHLPRSTGSSTGSWNSPTSFDREAALAAGFDAILGNPPWEIQKPNSKEFFSNLDPLYRTYGKQEALRHADGVLRAPCRGRERTWLDYCAGFKALSNWNKHAGLAVRRPDARRRRDTFQLRQRRQHRVHAGWARCRRRAYAGYADCEHPFRHQGSADINTYKMFLEQAHALLRDGGQIWV